MKHIYSICLISLWHFGCLGQHAQTTLVAASLSGVDRMSVIKNSVEVPTWHEKDFWPLYEAYMNNTANVSSQSHRSLVDLANIDYTITDQEALEIVRTMIAYRYQELSLKQKSYADIGAALNGKIALQFLQTEALIDMMQNASVYDQSQWKRYRFHPKALADDQIRASKHNMIYNALALSDSDTAFWTTYLRYEEECDALLGTNYDIISLYAGDARDYTPALAKQLGYNFLNVMEREIKLKEKYFNEMVRVVKPSLAARFLAWEDYYSLISKMHTWAETP